MNIKEFLGLDYYVSEIDKFLIDFDNSHHKLSLSQQKEIKKHKNIFKRKSSDATDATKTVWKKF